MASAEQPLKKRKLYEPQPETLPPQNLNDHHSSAAPPRTPPQLPPPTQEEIAMKRRNMEEIRGVYECYKRLRFCVSQKDARLTPDLEQAYLSLISASRGCTSVQRIVADLIPRYASYCPTALEAAAKVVINMHNWSLAIINREEDADDVAFQTAKACIFGLSDICCTASSEAPTSSVIRGICSAVFRNVLTFLISTFEGQNIFQIVDKEILKMHDSAEIFSELQQKFSNEDESSLIKLSKFRALSLLQIFFCCPKNSLASCFELFNSTANDGVQKGHFFLSHVTQRLDTNDVAHPSDKTSDGPNSYTGSIETSDEGNGGKGLALDGNHISGNASSIFNRCLLGMVLGKDPLLRRWILSKYKKLCKLSSSQSVSEIVSSLKGIVESFKEQIGVDGSQVDSDEDDSVPSNYITRQYLVPRKSNQHDTYSDLSGKDNNLRVHDGSCELRSNTGSNHDSGSSKSMDFETGEHGDLSIWRSSTPRDRLNNQLHSPVTRTSLDFRNSPFEARRHPVHVEKIQVSNMDCSLPPVRSSNEGVGSALASPNHRLPVSNPPTTRQIVWYSDGDPAAMDICSASKQLWLGSLGPDVSEAFIRFQFERFGPLEQFFFFPIKGFALVEYRNVFDAIKAREYMWWHFPWRIKFLDIGLGTRGAMNGVAIGSSSLVYIGNVPNQWAKDEILFESRKVVYRGPQMVTDLSSEGALLMEFETPEEAVSVMAHLRQHRKEKGNHLLTLNAGPANATMSRIDGPRSMPAPIYVDGRSNNAGNMSNNFVGSPHAQNVPESPADSSGKLTIKNTSYCQPEKHLTTSLAIKPESSAMEIVSPKVKVENHKTIVQGSHPFQSNWGGSGCREMPEVGARKVDSYDSNIVVNPSQGGHVVCGATEQMWMYKKPQNELHSAPGGIPCIPMATQGPPIPPPQQIQASPFMRPVCLPPNSSWDARGLNHHFPLNPISPGVRPNIIYNNAVAAPFIPASVTPLAQIQGSPTQHHDQMFCQPIVPPPLSSLRPPQPDLLPPLAPSPPPLPQSQPPLVPPPPSSPPPITELSSGGSSGQCMQYQWQGLLCKSGVHYCTISAQRIDSEFCKYSNAISEPAEWPAKLDMTKRTDFQHVKSTFTSTPPHKREVCRLIPTSVADYKGFQDFISYLKQRECAGVIKIPAARSMWARLLFILPYSHDMCSMLAIAHNPSDCLIALVLPKETTSEWV